MDKTFKTLLSDPVVGPWWMDNLDFILDDNKFSSTYGWHKGKKAQLTKIINKRLAGNIKTPKLKENMLSEKSLNDKNIHEYAVFTCDGSLCVSFFRHLRNALAHKRIRIIIHKGTRYYHFCDYNKQSAMTAEICLSHDTLKFLSEKYFGIIKLDFFSPSDAPSFAA